VGYVGKDVESMIRDLTDLAVKMIREEESTKVEVRAQEVAEDALLDLLAGSRGAILAAKGGLEEEASHEAVRAKLREMLRQGALDDERVDLPTPTAQGPVMPHVEIMTPGGLEEMGMNLKDMLGQFMPQNRQPQSANVSEAMNILAENEAAKMIDMERVKQLAIERTEQHGIIFLDEIDKIAGPHGRAQGPDISREGVQRDILPIVEGSTVMTKHGMVRTDHILFIAAGAFHMAKPSDLIPELQGRFPIRVELQSLTREDFSRIVSEPRNSLERQYVALMSTEGVDVAFTDDGLARICDIAVQINDQTENIGARRLHTVMERVMEDIAFVAPESRGKRFTINSDYVEERLKDVMQDRDLSRYIL
jgi:ATP-dependent HslUV protease ATP-binding subunit HslU